MRRRVFALVFLLDLLSLAAGMVVASLVALETPFPWLAPAGLVRGSVFPLLGSLFTGLAKRLHQSLVHLETLQQPAHDTGNNAGDQVADNKNE